MESERMGIESTLSLGGQKRNRKTGTGALGPPALRIKKGLLKRLGKALLWGWGTRKANYNSGNGLSFRRPVAPKRGGGKVWQSHGFLREVKRALRPPGGREAWEKDWEEEPRQSTARTSRR